MFERFTGSARESVTQAQLEARERGDTVIDTQHVLLGVLWNADGVTRAVIEDLGLGYIAARERLDQRDFDDALDKLGIDMAEVRRRVEAAFGTGALDGSRHRPTRGHIPFSKEAKKSLELALREAINLRHNYIGVEHILLALTRMPDSAAAKVVTAVGIDPDAVHDQLSRRLRKAA